MRVGFIGLGKLGLPVSIAMAQKGHEVYGYDVDRTKLENYRRGVAHLYEPDIDDGLKSALAKSDRSLGSGALHLVNTVGEAVRASEIVFVAVPTPSRSDHSFDTSYVLNAMEQIGTEMRAVAQRPMVAIISTVLPGTTRREVAPALEASSGLRVGEGVDLCYNPSFIAMGTTIADFVDPEFVLIGESGEEAGAKLGHFYETIIPRKTPILHLTWEEAELTKVIYNTMIGFKIVYANTIMEICERMGHANADNVSHALSKATRRIVGAKYLRGGLGDGGECHPRDNLALSWLAGQLGLSTDPFGFVMASRQRQTEWIADVVRKHVDSSPNLPVIILGMTFKPDTNLTTESPSLLLSQKLRERGINPLLYDPVVNPIQLSSQPAVYVIGTMWTQFKHFQFPKGSIVIDPWRWLDGVAVRSQDVEYHGIGS